MGHKTIATTELARLIGATRTSPQRVAEFLDALDPSERPVATGGLRRPALVRLWELAQNQRELQPEHFVPRDQNSNVSVRHHGRNSLPLFVHFEKRFFRGVDGVIYGANFQAFSVLTGPGYFALSEHADRGELRIDYSTLPPEVPAGWPAVRSNEKGLGRLTYGFLSDHMRGVSEHVSIGRAYRRGEDIGAWFILCREDAG